MAKKVKEALTIGKAYKMPETVSFYAKELPIVKDWKVGGKYRLLIDVEQTSIGKDEYDEDSGIRARFKILKVKEAK